MRAAKSGMSIVGSVQCPSTGWTSAPSTAVEASASPTSHDPTMASGIRRRTKRQGPSACASSSRAGRPSTIETVTAAAAPRWRCAAVAPTGAAPSKTAGSSSTPTLASPLSAHPPMPRTRSAETEVDERSTIRAIAHPTAATSATIGGAIPSTAAAPVTATDAATGRPPGCRIGSSSMTAAASANSTTSEMVTSGRSDGSVAHQSSPMPSPSSDATSRTMLREVGFTGGPRTPRAGLPGTPCAPRRGPAPAAPARCRPGCPHRGGPRSLSELHRRLPADAHHDPRRAPRPCVGSNWRPAQRRSSATASSTLRALRYERVEVMASKASTAVTMRTRVESSSSLDAVRVSTTVEPLVVVADDVDGRGQEVDVVQDLRTDGRVPLDGLELIVVERAGLVDDAERDADLAHVVEQRGVAGEPPLVVGDAELLGDVDR
jgi:hypothetical protein